MTAPMRDLPRGGAWSTLPPWDRPPEIEPAVVQARWGLDDLRRLMGEAGFGTGDSVKAPEALVLYGLAAATLPRLIVETGTNKGISAALLALGAPGATVHTFDVEDHGARDLWARYRVADRVVFHHTSSLEVPTGEIEAGSVHLAFFDADHRAPYVFREWEAWRTRIAPGGLVLWHDSWWPEVLGVMRAMAEVDSDLTLLNLPTEQGLAVAQFRRGEAWADGR